MTPYTDLNYFGALAALAIPALILRWMGKDIRYWILAGSAAIIVAQFYQEWPMLVSLALFAVLQWGTAYGFQAICRKNAARSPGRRWGFYGALACGILPLVAARMLPMFTKAFTFGFLGISYVTFRSLDVVFGLNDGLIVALDAAQLFAFLFFFPPISSGPIDRYRRFGKDWVATGERTRVLPDLDSAVEHVFRGLCYKFIVAYLIKKYWLDPAEAQPGTLGMISYMYAYSLFLFFDFAGYSAFAVGASRLFGIQTPENFQRPFLSLNIRDFWTRWHISLSTWFRDHVYMRFVLASAKGKWFKSNHTASHIGYLITFGLMGLWHGLAINFIVYGLYHAALLIGYDIFKRWNQAKKLIGDGIFGKGFGILATTQAVCFGFLIFSGHLPMGWNTAHPKVKAGLHAANTPSSPHSKVHRPQNKLQPSSNFSRPVSPRILA